MKLPGLSLVFPAYNDARSLPDLLAKADRTARKVTHRYELIVVNDGSTDDTNAVLVSLSRMYPQLRRMHHRKNKGYGATIRKGLQAARMAWIFYTDGDGQYDPSELTALVGALDATTDVVNGYKIERADSPLRKIIGDLYNFFLHLRYPLPIRDVDCDFRLMRSSLIKNLHLRRSSGAFPLELVLGLHGAGARFREVPVHHYPRPHGSSQFFRPRQLLATLRELFGVR